MPKPKKEAKEEADAAIEAAMEDEEKADDAKKDTPEDAKPKTEDDDGTEAAKDEEDKGDEKVKEGDEKEEEKDGDGDTEMKDAEKEEGKGESGKKKKRKKSSTPAKEPKEPAVKRERRERKSSNAFTPDDFVHVAKTVKAKTGRGVPLGELKLVKESIESAPLSSPDLQQTHRLIYSMRGKPPKKEMKANILKFSGYLPPLDKDLDKEGQDAVDEEEEKKMGTKAYKLLMAQVKGILDLLRIDRSEAKNKDELIDLLLDFLGEPKEEYLIDGTKKRGRKSKGKAGKKKARKAKDGEDEEEGSEDEEDEGGKGKSGDAEDDYSDVGDAKVEEGEPSDEMLRRWVRAYVRCHNMKKSTVKSALDLASDKFGVDLSDKKQRFKELLTEEM